MKADVTSVGSYSKKVEISFPADKVKAELDSAYRDVGSRARLHGFRPGKVPRPVLEARFGPQITQDVATSLIQKGWDSVLTEHNLDPVGQPTVADRGEVTPGADFHFTITVDVRPSVEIANYTGLDVVYPPVEVGDDELARHVKSRLEGLAKLIEVNDRPVQKGDMVIVELVATDGETEVAREPGTMIRTEADPYYPGVDDAIVGMAIGEEKKVKLKFPENARMETIAGRELDVAVKVVSIQVNQVPELTDTVAGELGFEGGVEGMKVALRMQVQQGREAGARNQARANLLQALIGANPFQVPEAMIDSHLKMLVEELKLQQAYRGRDPRRMQFTPEQMADLRVRAEFAAKGGIILEFVSKKEAIGVSDADIEAKYDELAEQRGQTVEAIRGYFVKEDAVDELKARLLEEKTLDWLLERSKLVTSEADAAPAATPA